MGDEGGFAPNVQGAEESLEILTEAIKKAGYEGKVKIALDVGKSNPTLFCAFLNINYNSI